MRIFACFAVKKVTDRKLPDNSAAWPSWVAPAFFRAEVVTASDYEPFGGALENRTWSRSEEKYRYGFNGKENDSEAFDGDRFQDYGMRLYRPDLGRFVSVDPLASSYPFYTPYQFAGNKPVWAIDLEGLEEHLMNDGNTAFGPYSNEYLDEHPSLFHELVQQESTNAYNAVLNDKTISVMDRGNQAKIAQLKVINDSYDLSNIGTEIELISIHSCCDWHTIGTKEGSKVEAPMALATDANVTVGGG